MPVILTKDKVTGNNVFPIILLPEFTQTLKKDQKL